MNTLQGQSLKMCRVCMKENCSFTSIFAIQGNLPISDKIMLLSTVKVCPQYFLKQHHFNPVILRFPGMIKQQLFVTNVPI